VVTVPSRVQDESTGARLRRWADEWQRAARVMLSRSDLPKTGQIYDIVGTDNLFGEESLFINFGYWKNNPATLDEASRELARLLARSADFNAEDTIIDCGCGYGDQDLLWVNEFGVKHITGVNVATEQIEISTRRVADAGLADRIAYVHASATALPQEDESCTKVVALESAFHFPSRVDFFSEALRVLKPGGQLVTADIVPKETFFNTKARKEVARLGWRGASPKAVRRSANIEAYRELLLDVGFAEAETQSITNDVFRPIGKFLGKRLFETDMKHVNPLLRLTFTPIGFWLNEYKLDYMTAVAKKA
jgi:ubiquinone/menaquinone biosynthesis C-methylase UbiE